MNVSEDGTVTGSVDVSKLGEIEPKTDEARAQLDQLRGEAQASREQATADAERLAEQARAQDPTAVDDDERERSRADQQADAERQQHEADQRAGQQAGQQEDLGPLRAEAEAAGVTVDKRWGADRLRQETAAAQAKSSQKQR